MTNPETSPARSLPDSRSLLPDLALISVAFIWGVNIPVMKVALEYNITPYFLNAVRLIVSACTLILFAVWEFRRGFRPAQGLRWWRVFAYGMIVSVGYQFLFLLAVANTTSANIALIMATVPMWTALGARVFLREILSRPAWTGLVVAFAGTLIVTLAKSRQTAAVAEAQFFGNVIALCAALTWAGGTVFSRPLLRTITPLQLAACSTTIALPFHFGMALNSFSAGITQLGHVPLQLCILYSGILSTGFALAMWSYGVKHAGAAQATMFQNLSPLIAILTAWLWRGEPVALPQYAGGGMILGGLLIMRLRR